MLFLSRQLDLRPWFALILARFKPPRVLAPMLVAPLVLLCFPSSAGAQNLLSSQPTGTQYPSQEYYLGLQAYRAGDLDSAGDLFEAAMRSARRDVHGRWVDSIPSLAMLAECHWHMGSLPTAHETDMPADASLQVTARSPPPLAGRIRHRDRGTPTTSCPPLSRAIQR